MEMANLLRTESEKITTRMLDLHGLFEHNTTFDYSDYEYKEDCIKLRSFVSIFVIILYSVALVLGLTGHVLVLVVLWQKRRSWSVTDAFVLHLSIVDILLLLTIPLWAVDANKGWSFGTGWCKVTGALFKINFYCGIFLLTCISLDLYFCIVHAVQMRSRTMPWLVQLICLAVWFFSLLLSIPDWMYLKAPSDPEQEETRIKCMYEYPCPESHLGSHLLYNVVGFLLPIFVLFYCYACILLKCRSNQGVQKHGAVRVILALVLAFIISWTPYNIALFVDTFSSSSKSPEHCKVQMWTAVKSTAVLGFLHSCINPLIYFGFSRKFRRWMLTVMKCGSCAVDSNDFFPWDSKEIDNATPATEEEKGSLQPMTEIGPTIKEE
ncbi:C-X-C chemokine receptor type 3-like isoform 1-T1 [Clarias gariepinus]